MDRQACSEHVRYLERLSLHLHPNTNYEPNKKQLNTKNRVLTLTWSCQSLVDTDRVDRFQARVLLRLVFPRKCLNDFHDTVRCTVRCLCSGETRSHPIAIRPFVQLSLTTVVYDSQDRLASAARFSSRLNVPSCKCHSLPHFDNKYTTDFPNQKAGFQPGHLHRLNRLRANPWLDPRPKRNGLVAIYFLFLDHLFAFSIIYLNVAGYMLYAVFDWSN